MGSTGKFAVDVTVIHSLAPSQHHSLTLATSCIKAAENRKTALYETVCVNAGWSFSPCALNTFGALGVDAVALLRRISAIKDPQPDARGPSTSSTKDISTDLPDSPTLVESAQQLTVATLKGVVQQLLQHFSFF